MMSDEGGSGAGDDNNGDTAYISHMAITWR